MDWSTIEKLLTTVGGGMLASLVAVFVWEWMRRSKIRVRLPSLDENGVLRQELSSGVRCIYHVVVENTGVKTASRCRATVSVQQATPGLCIPAVEGIWNRGVSPMLYTPLPEPRSSENGFRTAMGLMQEEEQIIWGYASDLGGKDSFLLPLCIKYDSISDCHLFSLETYADTELGMPKVREKALPEGEYLVTINIEYDSPRRIRRKQVRLRNFGTGTQHISLEIL